MKFFYCILLSLPLSLHANGQFSQKLDSQVFFTSIRFGDKIPPALADCGNQANGDQILYSLHLQYDSLQAVCRKQYADLFSFLSTPFSFSNIIANDNGEILYVGLYSFFEEHKSTNSIQDGPIPGFTALYEKLVSLYGKPLSITPPADTDSLFLTGRDTLSLKDWGMEQEARWEGFDITLNLRTFFGASVERVNILVLSIRNKNFDRMKEIEIPEP